MTIILTHGDGDGICAAAITKMVSYYKSASVFITHPMGLAQDLLGIDEETIILDVALDKAAFDEVSNLLDIIAKKSRVLYIDHHELPGPLPSSVEVVNTQGISATELTYRYFYKYLPEYASHFACIGAICDYLDDTPFMEKLMHQYERRSLFLDAGFLAQGLSGFRRNYDGMRMLIDRFSQGQYPCEVKKLVQSAIKTSIADKDARKRVLEGYNVKRNIAWIRNPKASQSKSAHWIVADSNKVVGLAISDRKSNNHVLDIAARGRNLIDITEIIPPLAKKYEGSGGGHPNAVGARIEKRFLKDFLGDLDVAIGELNIEKPLSVDEFARLDDQFMRKEEMF